MAARQALAALASGCGVQVMPSTRSWNGVQVQRCAKLRGGCLQVMRLLASRMRMPQAMAVLHEARKSSVPLEKNLVLMQVAMATEESMPPTEEQPVVAEAVGLQAQRQGRVRANGRLTAENSVTFFFLLINR